MFTRFLGHTDSHTHGRTDPDTVCLGYDFSMVAEAQNQGITTVTITTARVACRKEIL